MTVDRMEQLARWYWAARRTPDTDAAKGFFRTQADNGEWDTLSGLCLKQITPDFSQIVASTSFSGDCA